MYVYVCVELYVLFVKRTYYISHTCRASCFPYDNVSVLEAFHYHLSHVLTHGYGHV